MTTFKQFFKENILIALIWDLPVTFMVGIPLNYAISDKLIYWGTLVLIFWALVLTSLKSWYGEEKVDKLEKRIK